MSRVWRQGARPPGDSPNWTRLKTWHVVSAIAFGKSVCAKSIWHSGPNVEDAKLPPRARLCKDCLSRTGGPVHVRP